MGNLYRNKNNRREGEFCFTELDTIILYIITKKERSDQQQDYRDICRGGEMSIVKSRNCCRNNSIIIDI